ncbi:MAG: EF-P lysine aminoacylase GenX [Patescibacteria group bacterium]|nr:MAG: EF-P lysine aminoacylase GenX [Patescibacteria group bacterium]
MNQKNWQKIRENKQFLQPFLVREKVIDAIREFFKKEGFHEVETPLLVQSPGTEPYLEVFESTLVTPGFENKKAYLLTSPELSMKKLLAAGTGSIFTICKSFRNGEGISSFHNPEFSILEWYRVDADYTDVMKDCEDLLLFILKKLELNANGKNKLEYQATEYDLSSPWERISVSEAFQKYAGVSKEDMLDEKKIVKIAKSKGYLVSEFTTWEEAYNQILLNEIEPHLGKSKPTILYDYPASQAALSKKKDSDPRFAERFEFYLAGIELGNAFSELTDADEQEARMVADLQYRKELGKVEYKIDSDFISALRLGLPRTGGIAVGVDRLVMLFANVPSIKDTLLFPVDDVFDYVGRLFPGVV